MATPTSRSAFKETCLRRLGKPVIKINVSEEQVDDRLDYALAKARDYHFDFVQKTYVPYQVTDLDKTNRYVPVANNIIEVTDLFQLSSTIMGSGAWNVQYQFLLTSMEVFRSMDMSNWVIVMQNLQMLQDLLVGRQPIRFNRFDNKLYIDMSWDFINTGDFLVYEAYVTVDPDLYTKVWGDPWLLQYSTAQIKQQWGENMKKYSGVQMLGGVSFNGQQIYDEATADIQRLEDAVIRDYSLPLYDQIG